MRRCGCKPRNCGAARRLPWHATLQPTAAVPMPSAPLQLTSETVGLLCALCTSRSMYAVIMLTFVSGIGVEGQGERKPAGQQGKERGAGGAWQGCAAWHGASSGA